MTTDVESLYVSSIDAKPITVDSWSDLFSHEHDEDAAYWEAFETEVAGESYSLLSRAGMVVGVVIDGILYRDYDDYASDLDEPALDESGWDELIESEPYESGAEGPMMNYWYPVDSIDDDADAEVAAVAIAGLPLCVVMVGGSYGLALTGGGMDLSWDICRAYIATGNLPPVHFADLPSFAGGHGESTEVAAAMIRSLEITVQHAERHLQRLRERF